MPRKTQKKAPNPTINDEQRSALKLRCQTDLYFLCKEVLGYKDMVPHVHQAICDTYVQKDPRKGIFEQSETKKRMVLAPRGTFKTCVDIGDIVQWILCFPNVRILLLTGKQDLAHRMVREVKQHFQTNDTLRELFPEFCPDRNSKWGTDDEFTSPARTIAIIREPTVSSSTIATINAGLHVEVCKPDDVVNEINSATVDQCGKVIEAFDGLTYLLEPGGYMEINGTRYKSWDLYGKLLEREAATKAEWEQNPDEREGEEYVPDFKFTILPVWKIKPGVIPARSDNGAFILKKDDVDLLFPERLKFREQYKNYRTNPTGFSFQMLNDPAQASGDERPFTAQLIDSHTIPYTQLPHPGACQDYILWDLAGVDQGKTTADFCVGAVGRVGPDGKLFIIDMVRGKWNAHQMAAQIVTLAKNYPTAAFTWIEDAAGARLLEPTIAGIAAQCAINVRIQWVKSPRFGGAKRYRIDGLAQFLRADKLWLANFLPNLDILKAELLDKNPVHDDCSDAISLMVKELNLTASPLGAYDIPVASKKEIARTMFMAAIYGEDDGRYAIEMSTPAPQTPEPAPQTFEAGILGYGMGR